MRRLLEVFRQDHVVLLVHNQLSVARRYVGPAHDLLLVGRVFEHLDRQIAVDEIGGLEGDARFVRRLDALRLSLGQLGGERRDLLRSLLIAERGGLVHVAGGHVLGEYRRQVGIALDQALEDASLDCCGVDGHR